MRRIYQSTLTFVPLFLILSGTCATPANAQPKAAGSIGSTVNDGDMSFKVLSMKCGISSVGTGYFAEKAQGQFCVVTVTFKAAKKKPVNYFSSNQKGFTKSGAEVDSKTLLDDQYQAMVDINPGIAVTSKIAYDVAKGDPLVKIEFHDSVFSGGIQVDLTHTLKK